MNLYEIRLHSLKWQMTTPFVHNQQLQQRCSIRDPITSSRGQTNKNARSLLYIDSHSHRIITDLFMPCQWSTLKPLSSSAMLDLFARINFFIRSHINIELSSAMLSSSGEPGICRTSSLVMCDLWVVNGVRRPAPVSTCKMNKFIEITRTTGNSISDAMLRDDVRPMDLSCLLSIIFLIIFDISIHWMDDLRLCA